MKQETKKWDPRVYRCPYCSKWVYPEDAEIRHEDHYYYHQECLKVVNNEPSAKAE